MKVKVFDIFFFLIFDMVGLVWFVVAATSFLSNVVDVSSEVIDASPNVTYSAWTPWSKCDNCWQNRVKFCLSPKCQDWKRYEERPCDRTRCLRQKHMKNVEKRLHIFREIKMPRRLNGLKKIKINVWSKWSRWSLCSPQCTTQRFKVCRKPGRCKMKRKYETAYCYIDNSRCEFFIQELLNRMDVNRKQYQEIMKTPSTTKKPKVVRRRQFKRECGKPSAKMNMFKIMGGRNSMKHKWPWHLAILNKFDELICSGTLIAPKWVLTASHCIRPVLKVRTNEYDTRYFEDDQEEFIISRAYTHPKYDKLHYHNDIALLRLPKALDLPVACLPNREPVIDEMCSIMGWGKLRTDHDNGSNILQEAKIPIVDSYTCLEAYKYFELSDKMICAGFKIGKIDTCDGDSGGGLMCSSLQGKSNQYLGYTVQGITSFGEGCGLPNKYGIYTNVYRYLDWIYSTIRSKNRRKLY